MIICVRPHLVNNRQTRMVIQVVVVILFPQIRLLMLEYEIELLNQESNEVEKYRNKNGLMLRTIKDRVSILKSRSRSERLFLGWHWNLNQLESGYYRFRTSTSLLLFVNEVLVKDLAPLVFPRESVNVDGLQMIYLYIEGVLLLES